MRFLMMVKMDPRSMEANPPPPELSAACQAMAEQEMKEGVMLDQGGLFGFDRGAEVRVENGQVRVIDGPYAETKEVIGGYAIFQLRSKDEAVERARRLMEVHAELWPGFEGAVEVRQYWEPEPGEEHAAC